MLLNQIFNSPLNGWGYVVNIIFLIVGIFFLVKGADFFVDGASSFAKKLKIPAIVIGLTVVSFGTSAPELAVSLSSSIKGESDMALGNVVGSNLCNILVVLGLSAVISPVVVKKSLVKREIPFLIGASILLFIFSIDALLSGFNGTPNLLSRGEALVFIAGIIAFCYMSIIFANKEAKQELELASTCSQETVVASINESDDEIKNMPLWKSLLFLIGGLTAVILSANFLITDPATRIAESIGLAAGLDPVNVKQVVALTVVAIGTSLPELVTSVVAAKKGENEIAIGNVVGSNIFNILFICGISGVILPLKISAEMITDSLLALGAVVLLFVMAKKDGKITRRNGGIFLGLYVLYVTYILVRLFFPQIVIPF